MRTDCIGGSNGHGPDEGAELACLGKAFSPIRNTKRFASLLLSHFSEASPLPLFQVEAFR